MQINKIDDLLSLKETVETYGLSAKKSLGQNFLLDLNLTRKIARIPKNLAQSTVIEVGSGPGGLTRALFLEGALKVIAIERDNRAIFALQPLIEATQGNLELVKGDALSFDYCTVESPKIIVANLPYNISTALLVKWLENAHRFQSMTLMFQREVANRLTAEVGTASYGRLSVMTQWCAKVKKCFDVPPEAFLPAPKVTSTVVHIVPYPKKDLNVSFKFLEKVVKSAFGQRRKMIRTSLKSLWGDATTLHIESARLSPSLRAENLSVEDFVRLAKIEEALCI